MMPEWPGIPALDLGVGRGAGASTAALQDTNASLLCRSWLKPVEVLKVSGLRHRVKVVAGGAPVT
jgi:methanogenic corrinoid protein MtbC1